MRRACVHVFGGGLLSLMLFPLVYAVWISFTPGELLEPPTGDWSMRWYALFFDSPQWTSGLINSLKVAALAVAGALLGGLGLALAVTRHRFRGARVLSSAVLLPLFVPAVVLGMALLPLMHRVGLWGSMLSLGAARSLWSLPVVFLVTRAALAEVDPDLELAARGLGAGPWRTLWRVTAPVIAPSIAIGAIMTFILSLNEFIMALFLGTPAIETLPKVIWPSLRYTLTPLVAAASGVTMALTLIGLLLASSMVRSERPSRWTSPR